MTTVMYIETAQINGVAIAIVIDVDISIAK